MKTLKKILYTIFILCMLICGNALRICDTKEGAYTDALLYTLKWTGYGLLSLVALMFVFAAVAIIIFILSNNEEDYSDNSDFQ